jgi:hypothetical protein
VSEFWRAGPTPSRRAAPGDQLRPSTSSPNGHRALPGRKKQNETILQFSFLLFGCCCCLTHTNLILKIPPQKNKYSQTTEKKQHENEKYIRRVIKLKSWLLFLITLHNRLELSCRELVPFFVCVCFHFMLLVVLTEKKENFVQ